MRLTECLDGLTYEKRGGDPQIAALEMDSRKASEGCLFFCFAGGKADGHAYAAAAAQKGAAAFIVERFLDELPDGAAQVRVGDARAAMARVAANFYGHPADGMKLVCVTGTNGKTSTTYIVKGIAEYAGCKVGLMGTIANMIGDEKLESHLTTPDPIELQKLLRDMADAGADLVVMEASAHAIHLRKLAGLLFDVAIFSNLTQDHLDYFGDMETYFQAKRALFTKEHCRFAVLNADDPCGVRIAEDTDVPHILYGESAGADVRAENIALHHGGVDYDVAFPDKRRRVSFAVPGDFSVYNSLASLCACVALGIDADTAVAGLARVRTIHGRCESLDTGGRDFSVILDYAHSPDSLENILTSVRRFTRNRLLVVFGCGGDRDPLKRPIMGGMAGRYADYCIVTSDNPRTEDPMAIIAAILPGLEKTGTPFEVVENRRRAIARALQMAGRGDVVVLAGKGHETYQDIMGVKHPFDEKEIVAELFSQMK